MGQEAIHGLGFSTEDLTRLQSRSSRAAPFWSSGSVFKLLWTSSSIGLRLRDSAPCAFRTESPIFLLVVCHLGTALSS